MKIYDISQELFTCQVYPGDPAPKRFEELSIEKGDICNLTSLSMCAHNGTHVDAPHHFYQEGKTVDQLNLESLIGKCYVTFIDGDVTAETAEEILKKARALDQEAGKRILIGGAATVTLEAAKVFSREKIYLIGNESQTVGPMDEPTEVHYELLGAEVVLLEGIRLSEVEEGEYWLNAIPLNLGGCDGAPCRAVLVKG